MCILAYRSNRNGDEVTRTVKYKCCHGYTRVPTFGGGCEKQAALEPILDLLEKSNVTEFRRLIKTIGLDEQLTSKNYTVFAPEDKVLEKIQDEISELVSITLTKEYVLYHILYVGTFFLHAYIFKTMVYVCICIWD